MTKDEVLFAFHRYVDNPKPLDVSWWVRAFPQFADDIRAHAVEVIDMEQRAAARDDELSGWRQTADPTPQTTRTLEDEMSETKDQFIVLCGSIVGNMQDGFEVLYDWSHDFYETRKAAIAAGWKERESDDFNIGVIRDSRLVSLDWMKDPIGEPAERLREIEEQIGLYEEEDEDA